VGALRSVTIASKPNPRDPARPLSLGFGFVEFREREAALRAVRQLHGRELDGHRLELRMSERATAAPAAAAAAGGAVAAARSRLAGRPSTKIVVRNVAFEATKAELRQLFAAYGQ